MKKNFAVAMILAGAFGGANAAEALLALPATVITTSVAGPHTVTGETGSVVGAKFFAADPVKQQASFVKVVFSFTAGNNVFTAMQNAAGQFNVASVSTKGNQIFGGNSTAGAVKLLGGCPATGCVSGTASGSGGITAAAALTNT
jgi:hypothetical protein